MVNVTQVIGYLRSLLQNPNIGNSQSSPAYAIDGAASMLYAEDNSRIMVDASGQALTALFVLWGDFKVTKVQSTAPLDLLTSQKIIIVSCLDNTQDRTGKYAQALVPQIRTDLFGCLLNYRIDRNFFPLQYVGDEMIKMDKARYWHRFEYDLIGRLQPPDGAPLDLSIFNTFTASFNSEIPTATNPMAQGEVTNIFFPPDELIPPFDNKE